MLSVLLAGDRAFGIPCCVPAVSVLVRSAPARVLIAASTYNVHIIRSVAAVDYQDLGTRVSCRLIHPERK
jgi:hypothetical protein